MNRAILVLLLLPTLAFADLRDDALVALKKATAYYRTRIARHGGYVYYTSLDLKERWGEGRAGPDTIFVQPPGTPTVGLAYLKAYTATGDKACLDAAKETAHALAYGQLQSGGWTQAIHFGPAPRLGKYRNGKGGSWNVSSLDDGQTQAALQFLIQADRACNFKDPTIHDAAEVGLKALLAAQFPSGGFPQAWTGPVAAKPVRQASYPDYDWKTVGRIKNYWDYYTLNDNLAGTVADTLLAAHEVYQDDKVRTALARLGDFLILAQMPAPQPGWCQQYNDDMRPMWARKFEPPALTGWESQDVIATLIRIARHTRQKKYLEPIGPALAYFNESLLPDGQVARYYELKTNRPLYMTAQYQLTYDDSAVPAHYGWKQPSRFKELAREFENARREIPLEPRPLKSLEEEVRRIVKDLDDEGRWITTYNQERLVGQPKFAPGFRYLSSEVFSRNVEVLSEYVRRAR